MGNISNYLERRLDRDPEPKEVNKDLRADIVRIILEKISKVRRSIWSFHSINDVYLSTPVHSRVYVAFMIHIRHSKSKKTVFSLFFSLCPFSSSTLPIENLPTGCIAQGLILPLPDSTGFPSTFIEEDYGIG